VLITACGQVTQGATSDVAIKSIALIGCAEFADFRDDARRAAGGQTVGRSFDLRVHEGAL
jgi:hypothetical protein